MKKYKKVASVLLSSLILANIPTTFTACQQNQAQNANSNGIEIVLPDNDNTASTPNLDDNFSFDDSMNSDSSIENNTTNTDSSNGTTGSNDNNYNTPNENEVVSPNAPSEDEVFTPNIPSENEVVTPNVPSEDEVVTPNVPSEDEVVTPNVPSEDEVVTPNVPSEDEVVTPNVPSEDEVVTPNVPSENETTTPSVPNQDEIAETDKPNNDYTSDLDNTDTNNPSDEDSNTNNINLNFNPTTLQELEENIDLAIEYVPSFECYDAIQLMYNNFLETNKETTDSKNLMKKSVMKLFNAIFKANLTEFCNQKYTNLQYTNYSKSGSGGKATETTYSYNKYYDGVNLGWAYEIPSNSYLTILESGKYKTLSKNYYGTQKLYSGDDDSLDSGVANYIYNCYIDENYDSMLSYYNGGDVRYYNNVFEFNFTKDNVSFHLSKTNHDGDMIYNDFLCSINFNDDGEIESFDKYFYTTQYGVIETNNKIDFAKSTKQEYQTYQNYIKNQIEKFEEENTSEQTIVK
jgi:hypothetical protein